VTLTLTHWRLAGSISTSAAPRPPCSSASATCCCA
jgi:hypothetical protein